MHIAANGLAAWQMIESKELDLIVCDWEMPKLTGIELLGRIRSEPSLSDLPFIMLTGTADQDHIVQAIQAGANYYVVKPFSREAVIQAVKMVGVQRRPSRAASAAPSPDRDNKQEEADAAPPNAGQRPDGSAERSTTRP